MKIPDDLKYTQDHEWIRVDGEFAFVGITDFAQSELGDVVFVEVETVGEEIEKEDAFGTIEAVKTVSDMFMPVGGEIVEFNEKLQDAPDLINQDPYGDGWVIKVKMSDPSEINDLMDAETYKGHIGE
ncbi:MAG: glycine cleavage system protein GcvH [Bacteroidales bacterium]|jgi:glycine cleavage system H protein|nr:glycine cleavage system protein GcvH [Bacteroidales bacterium]